MTSATTPTIRPGRVTLGAFVAALGAGVIILQVIEENVSAALPFALLVAAIALIITVVSRRGARP